MDYSGGSDSDGRAMYSRDSVPEGGSSIQQLQPQWGAAAQTGHHLGSVCQ